LNSAADTRFGTDGLAIVQSDVAGLASTVAVGIGLAIGAVAAFAHVGSVLDSKSCLEIRREGKSAFPQR